MKSLAIPAALAAKVAAARLEHHAADTDLLRRVVEQTHVARTPSAPSIMGWFGALAEAFVHWLSKLLSLSPGLAEGLFEAAGWIAIAVLTVAVALLLLSIVRRVRLARGRRGPSVPSLAWTEVPESPTSGDRLEWRKLLEERLERGDIAGALEALWWWIALSIAPGSGVDGSWTTRELLETARRPELGRLGATLDVLMYGRRNPSREDVADCLARFEERLA